MAAASRALVSVVARLMCCILLAMLVTGGLCLGPLPTERPQAQQPQAVALSFAHHDQGMQPPHSPPQAVHVGAMGPTLAAGFGGSVHGVDVHSVCLAVGGWGLWWACAVLAVGECV